MTMTISTGQAALLSNNKLKGKRKKTKAKRKKK